MGDGSVVNRCGRYKRESARPGVRRLRVKDEAFCNCRRENLSGNTFYGNSQVEGGNYLPLMMATASRGGDGGGFGGLWEFVVKRTITTCLPTRCFIWKSLKEKKMSFFCDIFYGKKGFLRSSFVVAALKDKHGSFLSLSLFWPGLKLLYYAH